MNLIVAFSKNMGIGYKNNIPWHFKNDLKYFKKITIGNNNNAVIMGRKTWESLPVNKLPKRDNLILSKTLKGDNIFSNINDLDIYCKKKKYDDIWIIGGEKIYKEFMNSDKVHYIYTTEIDKVYKCDTFFPTINLNKYKLISSENNIDIQNKFNYKYNIYKNIKNIEKYEKY